MQILLEVKDKRAKPVINMLKELKYVKTTLVKDGKKSKKQEILDGLKEAVEEVKLHRQGKIKLKTAKELLDEL